MALAGVIVGGSGGSGVRSNGATYAPAREGTGTKSLVTFARQVGQARFTGPTSYSVYQAGLAFSVAALGSLIMEEAFLQVRPWTGIDTTVVEAVASDWGTVLDTGDFVPGETLEGIARYGSLDTALANAYALAGQGGAGGRAARTITTAYLATRGRCGSLTWAGSLPG